MQYSLNELYTQYFEGLLRRREFEVAIFKTLRENAHRFGLVGWNKDEIDDYLSSLYLRISQAVDTYQDVGSSFESYINSTVRLTAREFRTHQFRIYLEEAAAWVTQAPEMYAYDNEAEYDDQIIGEEENQIKPKNPRQLLILILKCSNYVSIDLLEKAAPQLGIGNEALGEMIDLLKKQREKREMEVAVVRERVNRQFYRCILFEKRLKALIEDSDVAMWTRKKLEKERGRLEKSRRRLTRMRLDPSNAQIAQLLGIKKGTVDAVLYNLKKRDAL